MAIRRGAFHFYTGDRAICAGLVFNDHGLAQCLGQRRGDDPGNNIS
jgi:hypothetical protein